MEEETSTDIFDYTKIIQLQSTNSNTSQNSIALSSDGGSTKNQTDQQFRDSLYTEENNQYKSWKSINRKFSKNKDDRFIANRKATITEETKYKLQQFQNENDMNQMNNSQILLLKSTLIDQNSPSPESGHINKLINYKEKQQHPKSMCDQLQSFYKKREKNCQKQQKQRYISQTPEKILDAPEIKDDYYLNLMDWGDNGILAVSLNQSVYLWNSYTQDIQLLLSTSTEGNYISSVSWMNKSHSNCLAVGFANNTIQLWDVEKISPYRSLHGHTARVSSLSWNNYILSSGSRDTTIINNDVRAAQNVVSRLEGHTQEICGLKWSWDGTQLASGSNDNNLMIWDLNLSQAQYCFNQHKAAVKALAWCPWQKNLLASGGGTQDKTMKFWNTDTGSLIQSINTDSQVCAILWNRYDKELITSHGFSKNQLCVWKYPCLTKITELHGHQNRVLHLALSPNGSTVCSAASDETLRFWKVFETPCDESKKSIKFQQYGLNSVSLR